MKRKIKLTDKGKEFLIQEIEKYFEIGFGSLNKSDFEILLFHSLSQGEIANKTAYEVSRLLKISVEKVKKLRYNADLKYEDDEDLEKYQQLENVLGRAVFYESEGKISVPVYDKNLREFIQHILTKQGRVGDYSNNEDMMILTYADIEEIYGNFPYANDELNKILSCAKKTINPGLTLSDLLKGINNAIKNGNIDKSSMIGFGLAGIGLMLNKFSDKIKGNINKTK